MTEPTNPEPDPAAVTASARDLQALLTAYGTGDEEGFNSVLNAMDGTELKAALCVAVSWLHVAERQFGTALRVDPALD
jgi:hypothetical protein